jgi:hypothetical protein
LFRERFSLDEHTRILDLGSEDGANIHSVLEGTRVSPGNVYIADIDAEKVARGHDRYGFTPVVIDEASPIAFPDKFFDIVYCSSVIEHVTIPKEEMWRLRSGRRFVVESRSRQREFADQIRKLGRQYFVQTPNKNFPVESHSWLPFLSFFPRWLLVPTLRLTNRFWIKKTIPDWCLLTKRDMSSMFSGAQLVQEKSFGLTKSLVAIRADPSGPVG